ncbi:hypothetical protein AVEN_117666-1 [Araneus ventricosus]|uniref:Uncharacterized protein n=1 Tax=Araneus ventricosus TaxID=182803 RepID=A0A4Y2UC55_ARAVE|nr:hypothetical protein AVEN_117666-1 [Araneus ventricosus]
MVSQVTSAPYGYYPTLLRNVGQVAVSPYGLLTPHHFAMWIGCRIPHFAAILITSYVDRLRFIPDGYHPTSLRNVDRLRQPHGYSPTSLRNVVDKLPSSLTATIQNHFRNVG